MDSVRIIWFAIGATAGAFGLLLGPIVLTKTRR